MIEITIEYCRTLKATSGMGDGMDIRVVGGIEHLTVLIIRTPVIFTTDQTIPSG